MIKTPIRHFKATKPKATKLRLYFLRRGFRVKPCDRPEQANEAVL